MIVFYHVERMEDGGLMVIRDGTYWEMEELPIPNTLFPVKKLSHIDLKFSDCTARTYDELDGFEEV